MVSLISATLLFQFCGPATSVKQSSDLSLIPYSITPALPGTPDAISALLGKWEGLIGTQKVSETYEIVLIVEKVNLQAKKAQIVFAWNPPFEWASKKPGCKRFIARLIPGPYPVIKWGKKVKFVFELKTPSLLSGEAKDMSGYSYFTNMHKAE